MRFAVRQQELIARCFRRLFPKQRHEIGMLQGLQNDPQAVGAFGVAEAWIVPQAIRVG
jgi:hypothetical protein